MEDINVKKVDSIPDHINIFLESNKDAIIQIYNDEKNSNEDKYGIILIQMDIDKNKVDITYITDEINKVSNAVIKEMWIDFETNKKQIVFIMDNTHGNFVIDLNDTV